MFKSNQQQETFTEDLLLAHKVIRSGKANVIGCQVPVRSKWNIMLLQSLLVNYRDKQVVDYLNYGFPVSRDDNYPDPSPANCNTYFEKEDRLGATIGPFCIPPFFNRIGVFPLSTRPKRDSSERCIILDLSYPFGASVNDGIDKDFYCREHVCQMYPTIDTLAARVAQIGVDCRMWKKEFSRFFRQLPLYPCDYSLIGMHWRNMLFFDKSIPMGLR